MSFDQAGPSPEESVQQHENADTDSSPFAAHHTIGTKPNQAADGKAFADLVELVKELELRIEALEP